MSERTAPDGFTASERENRSKELERGPNVEADVKRNWRRLAARFREERRNRRMHLKPDFRRLGHRVIVYPHIVPAVAETGLSLAIVLGLTFPGEAASPPWHSVVAVAAILGLFLAGQLGAFYWWMTRRFVRALPRSDLADPPTPLGDEIRLDLVEEACASYNRLATYLPLSGVVAYALGGAAVGYLCNANVAAVAAVAALVGVFTAGAYLARLADTGVAVILVEGLDPNSAWRVCRDSLLKRPLNSIRGRPTNYQAWYRDLTFLLVLGAMGTTLASAAGVLDSVVATGNGRAVASLLAFAGSFLAIACVRRRGAQSAPPRSTREQVWLEAAWSAARTSAASRLTVPLPIKGSTEVELTLDPATAATPEAAITALESTHGLCPAVLGARRT